MKNQEKEMSPRYNVMANNMNTQSFFRSPDISDDVLGIKTLVMIGIFTIFLFFGVFGVWAAITPLESAAIASGVVTVDSKRKTIQHLEGGIIAVLNVHEGQKVKAGDILIHLEETQPRANLKLLEGRYLAARALEARLLAERDRKQGITFPDDIIMRQEDITVANIIKGQQNIFNVRRQALFGKIAIINKQIQQYKAAKQGLHALVKTQNEQLKLLKDEIDSNKILFEKGLSGNTRILQLQREMAGVSGKRSQNLSTITKVKNNIDEALLQIVDLNTSTLNEEVQQLDKVQREQYDLAEIVRTAQDVLKRMVIRSTLDGTIVNLRVHTVGGVISPGQDLMDIVPVNDRLIIETRVKPRDINVIAAGRKALIRLTAFSRRRTQPIEGRVITVSADRLIDERTGADYFLARVELTGKINEYLNIYPGMQAEVMIVKGAQTTLSYLTRPITQSMNRAFREN